MTRRVNGSSRRDTSNVRSATGFRCRRVIAGPRLRATSPVAKLTHFPPSLGGLAASFRSSGREYRLFRRRSKMRAPNSRGIFLPAGPGNPVGQNEWIPGEDNPALREARSPNLYIGRGAAGRGAIVVLVAGMLLVGCETQRATIA